uniref:Uncharacterized protein n=1 Tax=Knipowitschia caucasica TaxID=637954 RepID=A0AAV2JCD3_KNICA
MFEMDDHAVASLIVAVANFVDLKENIPEYSDRLKKDLTRKSRSDNLNLPLLNPDLIRNTYASADSIFLIWSLLLRHKNMNFPARRTNPASAAPVDALSVYE